MKPMLAHIYEDKRWMGGPVWLQPKFNGVRALYQNGRFQSRDGIPWNPSVLAHLEAPLRQIFPSERTILDGELYVHGWSLQDINSAISVVRHEPSEQTKEVGYYVFDSVDFTAPFFIRFNPVAAAIIAAECPLISAATTVKTEEPSFAERFYQKAVSEGFEGIMYRIGLCPYTRPKQEGTRGYLSDKNNRTWHLLKRKSWQDDEFKCIGLEEGEGKRAGMTGRLTFSCRGGTFGAGSGLTEAQCVRYWNDPPVGKRFKIKFLNYTDDGIPFNPTIMQEME